MENSWENFKKEHERQYTDEAEEQKRREIFMANLQTIQTHNEKFKNGEVTWQMGINKFSDLTPEEMNKYTGAKKT